MTKFRSWAVSALAGALMVACGGGDPYVPGSDPPSGAPTTKGNFTAVVSFGTSVSDVGTYTAATAIPATSPQLFWGGRFTTNGAGAKVWVENVAEALAVPMTAAEVLIGPGQSLKCPAAQAGAGSTCTAYGQGGAMVTNPIGIRHDQGLLTVPLKTQIANHLARFGSFKADDLILVEGGLNDVFVQIDAFVAAATQIQTDAALGRITADQANRLLLGAQLAAMGEVKKAALELAGYVRDEILAKGGKYVAVANAVDLSRAPEGSAAPAAVKLVLTGLSENFNLWLREGLKGQPVQFIDFAGFWNDAISHPSKYGFVNVTTPACDKATIEANTQGGVTDGVSLFCNSTPVVGLYGLAASASVNTWMFADGNHPTTGGHRELGKAVLDQLRAFGWI